MFRMTCDIKIGLFKPVKPNAVTWNRSVDNFSDTATIKLPAITMLKTTGDLYQRVQTGLQFKEGMNVTIMAGYNGHNDTPFKGFIRRINYTIPLEVECEGYSYQLRKKLDFNKSYVNTTVKTILTDLVSGTDIKLSSQIPVIPLDKATFVNCTGIQVLEWFKDKCLLTVSFNQDILYVGMQQLQPGQNKKFRLGWNVIKDNELKFNVKKEFADVRIQVASRLNTGHKQKAVVGKIDGQVKKYKSVLKDATVLNAIAQEKRNEIINRGYEGSITGFLKPFVAPGMSISIEDAKYPERGGKYFVTGVNGEYSSSGGRQKVIIGNSLGNG